MVNRFDLTQELAEWFMYVSKAAVASAPGAKPEDRRARGWKGGHEVGRSKD